MKLSGRQITFAVRTGFEPCLEAIIHKERRHVLQYFDMTHVFTYGSLMFDQVWLSVVDGTYKHVHGTLFGFERRCIRNEQYPALIPGPVSSSVDGVLYLNISAEDLQRLDLFEGSYYNRQEVRIHTQNNIFQAEAYILSPSYHHIVTNESWDPKRFGNEGIGDFISTYFGFDR